jgi:hypothetical protein
MNAEKVRTYTVTLIPNPDGVRAVCTGVPGCDAQGRNAHQALERIKDQLRARIMDAVAHRRAAPFDNTSTKFVWLNTEDVLV